MNHVVIFEPDASGHRMVFVRYLVEAIARQGDMRATLVTTARGVTPWVSDAAERLSDCLSVAIVDAPMYRWWHAMLPRRLKRQLGWITRLESIVAALRARTNVDHVFIPFLDDYALFASACRLPQWRETMWSGIAIRPRFHLSTLGFNVPRRRADRVERWAYQRLLRDPQLATLFSIDPYLPDAIADPRVLAICDPADIATPLPGAAWPSLPDEAVMLLVYGYIDHRKAIDRLLKVASDPRMPTSLVVVLVGTQDPGIASILQGRMAEALRAQGRLVEIARHVTDAEETSALMRADIVWGYYPGSYCSSGAMVRAGRVGRSFITTEEGLAGALTQKHRSGMTAPERDDEILLHQIARLVSNQDLRVALGAGGARAFANATGLAFGDQIVARLSESQGT